MERRNRLIVALAALVVLLSGALMFLLGRMSASGGAPVAEKPAQVDNSAIPAADSSTGGKALLPAPAAAAPPATPYAPAAAEKAGLIPAAFHGEWNRELEHCGTGLNDSALRIEPRSMHFYESRGDVTRITRTGDRTVAIEASFQGEGETWSETVQLTLSPDGEQLTTGTDQPRRRCR